MLSAGLGAPDTIPNNVAVGGQMWPIMPPPEQVDPPPALGTQIDQLWLGFNTGNPPPLLNAFGQWIGNGKPDDSPQNGPLAQPAFSSLQPPAFAGAQTAFLFVASFAGDDGRRNGDGGMPVVPLGHVPATFWATSQIFLYDAQGQSQMPPTLDAGKEYYVCAVIGNSCPSEPAGRAFFSANPINVICDAQCFNTFLSPAVPLPSLANYDPMDANPTSELYYLAPQSYDVAAFRFNVNSVFAALAVGAAGRQPGRQAAGRLAEGGAPVRQGAGDFGRAAELLSADGQRAALDQFQPALRPPHRPAQPRPVQLGADGDQEADVDRLHPGAGGRGAERARGPGARLAGGGDALPFRDPERAL